MPAEYSRGTTPQDWMNDWRASDGPAQLQEEGEDVGDHEGHRDHAAASARVVVVTDGEHEILQVGVPAPSPLCYARASAGPRPHHDSSPLASASHRSGSCSQRVFR